MDIPSWTPKTRTHWIRWAQGRSAEEVAREVGLSERHLRRIESGEVSPSLATMAAIYRALGLDVAAQILGDLAADDPAKADVDAACREVDRQLGGG